MNIQQIRKRECIIFKISSQILIELINFQCNLKWFGFKNGKYFTLIFPNFFQKWAEKWIRYYSQANHRIISNKAVFTSANSNPSQVLARLCSTINSKVHSIWQSSGKKTGGGGRKPTLSPRQSSSFVKMAKASSESRCHTLSELTSISNLSFNVQVSRKTINRAFGKIQNFHSWTYFSDTHCIYRSKICVHRKNARCSKVNYHL